MNLFEIAPRDYHQKLKVNRANIFSPTSWLSKSVLWELNESSLYKWRFCPREVKPTPAMVWGSLVDTLATTPDLEGSEIAVSPYPDFRTKEAREWKESQLAIGMTIVDAETLAEGRKAARMLTHTCKAVAEIFAKSKTQVIVGGKINGIQVKGLVDLAPEGEDFLADLKTTSNFTIEGFGRDLATRGYHTQAGIYIALWNSMFPDDQRTRFKLIWQDSSAPYEACVTEISDADIEAGWYWATTQIERLAQATRDNCWPTAFSDKEVIITRPVWASIQEDMKINPPTNDD